MINGESIRIIKDKIIAYDCVRVGIWFKEKVNVSKIYLIYIFLTPHL